MSEKREKMIGFMATKELVRKLRTEAAKRNTTMSTLAYTLVSQGLDSKSEQAPKSSD